MLLEHQEPISQWALQQEALRHLKDHGPLHWNALYIRFDAQSQGDIGPALQELEGRQFIERGAHNLVKITAAGIERLWYGA